MRLRARLIALAVAAVAVLSAASLAAPDTAQARDIYLYGNSFYPGRTQDPSGVVVRFVNWDWLPHRVVSYQFYWSHPWSLDITLGPGEAYTVPQPFTCGSGCLYETYLFREPNRSRIVTGDGYAYCSGYCGELVIRSGWSW